MASALNDAQPFLSACKNTSNDIPAMQVTHNDKLNKLGDSMVQDSAHFKVNARLVKD